MSNVKLIGGVVVGAVIGAAIVAGIYSSKCETCSVNEPSSELLEESGAFALESLDSDVKMRSYIIGTSIGKQMAGDTTGFEFQSLSAGIQQALNGEELLLTEEEMTSIMDAIVASETAKAVEKGVAFLAANMEKEGVTTLESGLQYKVLTEGEGDIPTVESTVEVHYRGTLIDGTEFDSSFKRGTPASFPVTGVIKGWTEALQLMKEGSKWELYVPSDLAYGERGAGPNIGPNSTLIFEIELLKANVAK